ncbi:hypothetical protein [Desulfonatronum thiodismutans]|uniref:hypothetical protein n=1 Tax=Desulfonatronum thiodismutans TaxID=159290 RepID=UPI0004ABDF07|nr:hypothetical protein [Desulfonatronum thiodismutans]
MAKKRTKPSKKGKKQKHAQQSRPESKLRHYWQEGKWDGFVAMYLRRHAEPLPQDLHDRWGDAVFNLLVQTLFVDRTPNMLPSLFEMLRSGPVLPGEVQACLELTALYHRSLDTDVSSVELEAVPADLPAPFGTLRAAMIEARETALRDAREVAERGLPKRATDQGVKALKGFVQSCEKLREVGFQSRTISTYKTLEKHAKALSSPLVAAGKRNIAVDLQVLVGICKHLFELQREGESASALQVLGMLTRNKFTFTDHPALYGLVDMLLDQAGRSLGPGVRAELQRSLRLLYPSRLNPTARSAPRSQAIQAAFLDYISTHGIPRGLVLHHVCVRLLRTDVWSIRERYVLTALGIKALSDLAASRSPLPFEQDDSEMDDVRTNIPAWLRDMVDIHERLSIQNQSRRLPFTLWDEMVRAASFDFLERQVRFLRELASPPRFPNISLLHLAELAEEVFSVKEAKALMDKLAGDRNQQAMTLSEKDCEDLVGGLDFSEAAEEALEAWRPYLEGPSWSRLLDAAATAVVDRTISMESANPFFRMLLGSRPDENFLRYMADNLPDTAPLSGFFRMISQTGFDTLPKGKKQAAAFFTGFPPPGLAVKLLMLMLSWRGGSVVSRQFLLDVIFRIPEELTCRNEWLRVVTELEDFGRKEMFPELLAFWGERGWVADPPSADFKEALVLVQKNLLPKTTPKQRRQAIQRKKQRTLF